MATATELTLTLGRTVYGGDPDSSEKIQAREARVSVTWSLGEDEQDVALTASALAEEAERALAQVGHARRTPPDEGQKPGGTETGRTHDLNGGAEAPIGDIPATSGPSADGAAGNGHRAGGSGCKQGAYNGHASGETATASVGTEVETQTARYTGYSPDRTGSGTTAAHGSTGARSHNPTPAIARAQPITRAQCLAVRSHCTRRGVAHWELLRLIAERFGKGNLEDLDKAQGGELLTLLQQAEHESEPGNPDYAN